MASLLVNAVAVSPSAVLEMTDVIVQAVNRGDWAIVA
jgi:hypothetical protein